MFGSMEAFFAQALLPLLAGICIGIASYQVGKGRKGQEKDGGKGKKLYHPEQMKKQKNSKKTKGNL